jgi:hypothetical protein
MAIIINELEVTVEAPRERSGETPQPEARPQPAGTAPSPAMLADLENRRLMYKARATAH